MSDINNVNGVPTDGSERLDAEYPVVSNEAVYEENELPQNRSTYTIEDEVAGPDGNFAAGVQGDTEPEGNFAPGVQGTDYEGTMNPGPDDDTITGRGSMNPGPDDERI